MSTDLTQIANSELETIATIPFENASSLEQLENFANAVGGVKVVSMPIDGRHYLGLNLDLKETDGMLRGIGSALAATPDEALTLIMKKVGANCAEGGLLLVVDAYSSTPAGRREFSVVGDAENGFVYRAVEEKAASVPQPGLLSAPR